MKTQCRVWSRFSSNTKLRAMISRQQSSYLESGVGTRSSRLALVALLLCSCLQSVSATATTVAQFSAVSSQCGTKGVQVTVAPSPSRRLGTTQRTMGLSAPALRSAHAAHDVRSTPDVLSIAEQVFRDRQLVVCIVGSTCIQRLTSWGSTHCCSPATFNYATLLCNSLCQASVCACLEDPASSARRLRRGTVFANSLLNLSNPYAFLCKTLPVIVYNALSHWHSRPSFPHSICLW